MEDMPESLLGAEFSTIPQIKAIEFSYHGLFSNPGHTLSSSTNQDRNRSHGQFQQQDSLKARGSRGNTTIEKGIMTNRTVCCRSAWYSMGKRSRVDDLLL